MTTFSFSFHIRSDDCRLPVSPQILEQPLLYDVDDPHPSLTMADYLDAIARLVEKNRALLPFPGIGRDKSAQVDCRITSEKLGAFYHVAKVELFSKAGSSCFAVNTAVSKTGRELLLKDHELLRRQAKRLAGPYIPSVLLLDPGEKKGVHRERPSFTHLVVEWLENFYEWHLCSIEGQARNFVLWTDAGPRQLTEREYRLLFRRIALIATLLYDDRSGSFLQDWHHAAGDFITGRSAGGLEVRLITIRALESFPFLDHDQHHHRFTSLILFLLDLSIRMRLDKLGGVGETVWFDPLVVEETVAGFMAGLKRHGSLLGHGPGDIVRLLAGFNRGDLMSLFSLLQPYYRERLPQSDQEKIFANLDAHMECLATCLEQLSHREL
jgi:hypothetical protein